MLYIFYQFFKNIAKDHNYLFPMHSSPKLGGSMKTESLVLFIISLVPCAVSDTHGILNKHLRNRTKSGLPLWLLLPVAFFISVLLFDNLFIVYWLYLQVVLSR
jgi:hypothetical protein